MVTKTTIKANRELFNRLLKAMAKGEPLPKGTFPEAEKSSRKGSGAGYGDTRTRAGKSAKASVKPKRGSRGYEHRGYCACADAIEQKRT